MNPFFRLICRSCGCAFLMLTVGCANAVLMTNNFRNNVAWAGSQQARIVVAGTVSDPQGNLLHNVQIRADYVLLLPTGDDLPRARTIRETRCESMNETFRLILSYATEAQVTFSKKGYRDETIHLAVEPRTDIEDSLAHYPQASNVVKDQLDIVLHPAATTAPSTAP